MAKYTEEDVKNAQEDIAAGISQRKASNKHGIPRSTLKHRIDGTLPRNLAHENQQRLSHGQEDLIVQWILRQESLGYAPTHANVKALAASLLAEQGDPNPLGKHWVSHFIGRHPDIKTKVGKKIDYARVNEATPENINKFFDLYSTVDWIKPRHRYNHDEVGIMEGQGENGLVIGSSKRDKKSVYVKQNGRRTWTTILECISQDGRVLPPGVIFKGKHLQTQWFKDQLNKDWYVAVSENGWISNDLTVGWLKEVFIPRTEPEDPLEPRLLICDGHGSHTTDDFMIRCYRSNIYLLFLPPHCSHVLQPLDIGCFSSVKKAYKRLMAMNDALTNCTPNGKVDLVRLYDLARNQGFRKENIAGGWRGTGLWPIRRRKPLSSSQVVVPEVPLDLSSKTPTFHTVGDSQVAKKVRDLLKNHTPAGKRLAARTLTTTILTLRSEASIHKADAARHQQNAQKAQEARKRRKLNREDSNSKFVRLCELEEARIEGRVVEEEVVAKEDVEQPEPAHPVRRSARHRVQTRRKREADAISDSDSE
ncbi:Putative protein of unknown function [Podospora comata]|uniref:HTH CENPB-type domain-containing protein n=1 Tax=Podospora comata TaxID=48703 RepID=A0ABY6SIX8_PODCO|nr:Putative protein of unknown function [Podospora comata]